jgi:hypothetical protein
MGNHHAARARERKVLLIRMEVRKTHHVEKGEPDGTGIHDHSYEYDLYSFSEGGLSFIARSYADEPTNAHFLRAEKDGKHHFLTRGDLAHPLFREATEYLLKEGKTSLRYLGAAGYEIIESLT